MSKFSGASSFVATEKHTMFRVPATKDRDLVVGGERSTNPAEGSIEIMRADRANAAASKEGPSRLISRSRMENVCAIGSDSPWWSGDAHNKIKADLNRRKANFVFPPFPFRCIPSLSGGHCRFPFVRSVDAGFSPISLLFRMTMVL
jgi:hypothetical protein